MSEQLEIVEIPTHVQEFLLGNIANWRPSLQELLPTLGDIKIIFDNEFLIHDTGTGGFASELDEIILSFDPDFKGDKDKQLNDLMGSYYHESYHTVQKFVGADDNRWIPIENAVYEGAATKFEMIHAGTKPGWGEYDSEILKFMPLIANMSNEEFSNDWQKWKFYDPESDIRWIMYRIGSYINDEAMRKSGINIQDLATMPALEILKLSEIKI